jgi:polar amino acid transport system substrate-binding protein
MMERKMLRRLVLAGLAGLMAFAGPVGLMGCGNSQEQRQDEALEPKTLVVGMELAYPPFEGKDDAGQPSGLSVDFMKDFAAAYGYDLQVENIAWDGLIPSLQTGSIDCIISSMTITEEREQNVDFSEPYARAQLALLANAASGVSSIDDINDGRTLAVKTGSTGDIWATANLPGATIVRLADESACVTEVVQGKADGFIYDQLTIYRNQAANPGSTTAIYIPIKDPEYWGIAVKTGNSGLLAELNAFIEQSKADGEFERLTSKHLADEKAAFDRLGFTWFFDF